MVLVSEVCTSIENRYRGIVKKEVQGEITYFYNPDSVLKNGVYFCTIKEADTNHDKSSDLSRSGIYRISTGITREMYLEMFGTKPRRPKQGETIEGDYDFTTVNEILPHPIHGWMSWVQVLSPSNELFERFMNYIDISYEKAVLKYEKKLLDFTEKFAY